MDSDNPDKDSRGVWLEVNHNYVFTTKLTFHLLSDFIPYISLLERTHVFTGYCIGSLSTGASSNLHYIVPLCY